MRLSSKGLGFGAGLTALAVGLVGIGAMLGQAAPSDSASGSAAAAASPSGPFSSYDRQSLRGLVEPGRQVTLGAPMGSMVKNVKVEEGDRVDAGERVAEFDYEIQQVVVELSRLGIKRERMRLDEAEIQLEKMQEAFKANAVQKWEVRKKKLQRDGSEVALKRAERNLDLEQAKLQRYYIRAPFAGYIHRIKVDEGASLRQGDPLLLMVSMDPLEAEMHLPIELYSQMKPGQKYLLRADPAIVPALEEPLVGTVKVVDPLIDHASGTFRCVLEIPNPQHKLPAGFNVRLIGPAEQTAAKE